MVRDNPNVSDFRADLGQSLNNIGILHGRLKSPTAAFEAHNSARTLRERLARDHPTVPEYQNDLAKTYFNLGRLRSDEGKLTDAIDLHRRACDLRETLIVTYPDSVGYWADLGLAWDGLGWVLERANRPSEALSSFEKAVQRKRTAFEKAPDGVAHRKELRGSLGALARTSRTLGRSADAATAVQERRRLIQPNDFQEAFYVAREFAMCVPLVASGKAELTTAEQAERQKYADAAMDVLREAVAHGYKDVGNLKTDKLLDPLRGRADFQKQIADLERLVRSPQ